jgi:hypothetical protein
LGLTDQRSGHRGRFFSSSRNGSKQMTEYTINSELPITAVTANTAFAAYDTDGSQRTKKMLASQLQAYLQTFGSGAAAAGTQGNINRQVSATGVSPGVTGADNVLAVYSLPANSFDIAGRGIAITAQGSFGATANNKRVKIIFNPTSATVGATVNGGTTVADTGTVATNGGGWALEANVFKYGATGSNTQLGLHQQAQVGGAVAVLLAPSLITASENGAILVAVSGNSATATSDIVFNFLEVNAMN